MFTLLLVKFRQGVEGTAKLECTDPLQVLAFEKYLGVEQAVDGARGDYRRAIGLAYKTLGSGFHVLIGGECQSVRVHDDSHLLN